MQRTVHWSGKDHSPNTITVKTVWGYKWKLLLTKQGMYNEN